MKRARFALIGAGNIAQAAVLPAFARAADACSLAAIISGDPQKRAELAHHYAVEWSGPAEHLEAILVDASIDAAYLALPNHLHREYTERCAAVGVHVLCEKPMAMTVSDCRAMIAACDAAKVKLMISYRLHFDEAHLSTLELLNSGAIGAPRFCSALLSHQVRAGDFRTQADAGGGALYDLGVYCVNAARNVFQGEPLEVNALQAFGLDRRFAEVDKTTTAVLRFSEDRFAQFTVSQAAAPASELRIVGTRGDVQLAPAFEHGAGITRRVMVAGRTEETAFPAQDQFAAELEYFAMCVRDGVDPEPSGLEGLADIRVLEAIVRSAQSGAPVRLRHLDKLTRPDMSQNLKRRAQPEGAGLRPL